MTTPIAIGHVGIAVPNLQAAMTELHDALGLEWGEPTMSSWGPWELRISLSIQEPPFFELIEGPPDSPWDATEGPRFDHIGYWVPELETHSSKLTSAGVPVLLDGKVEGKPVNYHFAPRCGLRLEAIDEHFKAELLAKFGITAH